MAKLDKLLQEWTAQGFINSEQAGKIHRYESAKPKTSWFLYGTLTLGVSVLGMGIISLIAANWHQIGDYAKLFAAFSILSVVAIFASQANKASKHVIYDVLVLALQALSLATIGLISQIYHTDGELYQALMFWTLITLPVVITTEFAFAPFIWAGSFIGASLFGLIESKILQIPEIDQAELILVITPLFAAVLAIIARLLRGSAGIMKAMHIWVMIGALIGLSAVEFWSAGHPRLNFGQLGTSIISVLSLMIVAPVAASKLYSNVQKVLLTSLVIVYIIAVNMAATRLSGDLLGACFTLIELGLLGAFYASQKARGRFNIVLMLMGLRFFVLFLQALRGLAMTGFGLILSGIILIALASVWNKRRHQIAAWMERITQ
jgi:hypothetical protein